MPERWLTFAEVEEMLGLTADEVRSLMEGRRLNGRIVDGVVKFDEAEVRRAGGTSEKSGEAQFKFLVDEEEERRIEGKAYDGESLAPPKPIERIADDEELIEPEALTEELLRNAELLGGKDIVEFGREVAERSTQEYKHPEIADAGPAKDEEIIEPSTVELPEVPFGPLAERISDARREEPPEAVLPPAEPPAPACQGEALRSPEKTEEKIEFVEEETKPACQGEALRSPEPVADTPTVGYEVEETEVPEAAAMHVDESVMPAPETPPETYEVEPPPPVAPVTRDIERAVDEETADEPVVSRGTVPTRRDARDSQEAPIEEPVAASAKTDEPEPVIEKQGLPIEPAPLAAMAEEIIEAEAAAPAETPSAEPPAPEPEPQPTAEQDVTPIITPKEEVVPEPVLEPPEPVKIEPEEARKQVEEIDAELSQIATKESLPEAQEDGRISRSKSGEEKAAEAAEAALAEVSHEEAKPVTDKTKPTPEEQKKKKPEEIEVFDLGEQKPKEEEFELLEEEPEGAPGGAAGGKEKTLEEEMAELFGDESKEGAPAAAAGAAAAAAEAPKVEEDFDLSVFQKDKQEAEAAPAAIAEEELFNVTPTNEAGPEQTIGEEDVDHQSRIKSVIEERTPASVYLYTAAILLSFIAVGLTGMLLWHAFIMK